MKRGDVVVASERGRLTGKPRPWLVLQAEAFLPFHPTVTICPFTTDVVDAGLFRIAVPPSPANGLAEPSAVMVDKLFSLSRDSVERVIGTLEDEHLVAVEDAVRDWLDL